MRGHKSEIDRLLNRFEIAVQHETRAGDRDASFSTLQRLGNEVNAARQAIIDAFEKRNEETKSE
jgi:hypothetical protein